MPNVAVREKRVKKESLKTRESKAAEGRGTPEPKRKEGGGASNESTVTFSIGTGGGGAGSGNETASTTTKTAAAAKANEGLPVRVRLAGPLRPSDFEPPASPINRARHSVQLASGQEVEFLELFSEQ